MPYMYIRRRQRGGSATKGQDIKHNTQQDRKHPKKVSSQASRFHTKQTKKKKVPL